MLKKLEERAEKLYQKERKEREIIKKLIAAKEKYEANEHLVGSMKKEKGAVDMAVGSPKKCRS